MTFQEFKTSANQDKSKQLREYEIVYKDAPLIFDLFFRFYEDITDALLGKQVYVPNLQSMYDKEVSLLAYIHRLDMSEEVAQKLKDAKVDNITDFLKQKIQTTGSMKKYLDVVSKKFISAKSLNYKDMTTEDKRQKLHGIKLFPLLIEYGINRTILLSIRIDQYIFNGSGYSPEVARFQYRKLFGMTEAELEQEPVDTFYTNLYIYAQMNEKQRIEAKHG